jgi:SAM-dependent methyltransferase
MLTREQARHWLDRWDRQQEHYLAVREERFTVIADVVQAMAGRENVLIVDLGVGPGSLAVRLLDHLPKAQVVGIDADPLLLGLARTGYGDRSGLRLVHHDLREAGWVDALSLERAPDAIVSTTALHWLTGPQLAAVYRACGGLLPPGGVLVNGDHFQDGPARPRLDALTRSLAQCHTERTRPSDGEDWVAWWDAITRAPELADLVAVRRPEGVSHHLHNEPTLDNHLLFLQEGGFDEVGVVWQHGDNRVLVAVR